MTLGDDVNRKLLNLKYIIFLFFVTFQNSSFGFGEKSVDSVGLEKESLVVLAIKVKGRISCGDYKSLLIDNNLKAKDCSDRGLEAGLSMLNNTIAYEEFIVSKVLKGEAKVGDLIRLSYQGGGDVNSFSLGDVALLFVSERSKKDKTYYFDYCKQFYFEDVEKHLNSDENLGAGVGGLIKYLIDNKYSPCRTN